MKLDFFQTVVIRVDRKYTAQFFFITFKFFLSVT